MPRPLSGRTERIRLGIGVSQLPLHNPVSVAEEAATVDIVTAGRLDFGLGRGTWSHNFDGFGIPWEERTSRLEEAIDILERAWAEAPLTYPRPALSVSSRSVSCPSRFSSPARRYILPPIVRARPSLPVGAACAC